MSRHPDYLIHKCASDLARAITRKLASGPMDPREEEWWRRLMGNLDKAQTDNSHLGRKHHGS